jgi:hypothetical protein
MGTLAPDLRGMNCDAARTIDTAGLEEARQATCIRSTAWPPLVASAEAREQVGMARPEGFEPPTL